MRFITAMALALALAGAPALAIEIDPNNLPPWPKRHIGQNDMPSRFDHAPVDALLAAKDAGVSEAGSVYWRRLSANDPAMMAWARAAPRRTTPAPRPSSPGCWPRPIRPRACASTAPPPTSATPAP